MLYTIFSEPRSKIISYTTHYLLISGFRRLLAENCVLLDHYAANNGNILLTFRDNLSVPSLGFKNPKKYSFGFLNPEEGTDRLSRNVGKKLPLLTA
jgi:hypothetical protein